MAMRQAPTIEILDDGSQLVEGVMGSTRIECPVRLASRKPVCQFKTYSTIWKAVRR